VRAPGGCGRPARLPLSRWTASRASAAVVAVADRWASAWGPDCAAAGLMGWLVWVAWAVHHPCGMAGLQPPPDPLPAVGHPSRRPYARSRLTRISKGSQGGAPGATAVPGGWRGAQPAAGAAGPVRPRPWEQADGAWAGRGPQGRGSGLGQVLRKQRRPLTRSTRGPGAAEAAGMGGAMGCGSERGEPEKGLQATGA
jgi:hypothetical protein